MMRKLLGVAVIWLIACSALAQRAGTKEEASAHFRQGVELFREGAYRAALVELQRAYEIAPDYRVLFNIGQTQLQVGEYVAAIRAFELYLVQGGSNVDAARREEVERDLAALRKRVATLVISVSVDGATVYVDNDAIGKSPLPTTVPVSVGRHRVFAQAEDGSTASQTIDVAGGDFKEIKLEVVAGKGDDPIAGPAPAENLNAAPRFTSRQRWGIGLLAGGGALLAGSLITGLMTNSADDDYQKALKEIPRDNDAIRNARGDVKAMALTTDMLLIAGAATAVTGTVLLLVKGKKAEEEEPEQGKASLSVKVSPTWVGLGGRF